MKTHLVFAIMTVVLLALVISQTPRHSLTFDDVISQARRLAAEPWRPVEKVPSEVLQKLNYDQYRDIRLKDEHTLWQRQGLPFQARFFFTGHIHSEPVTIYQVNREGAGPVPFSPDFFNFGTLNTFPPEEAAKGGYAGFRVHYPINRSGTLDEFLVFLGASYFRAVPRDQVWGLSARGIAIDTEAKEEFPAFTTFWLVEPSPGASELKIYALLDGKSISGAYEFVVIPGAETKMRVRAVLFPRRDIKRIGIAPLTSMYWFGENTSNTFGDFRPEVHDSDGLQVALGNGEWIWRPLAWSWQLQINTFTTEKLRGFGLFQRDRDFSHYQDLEANYHQRPSAWVEPEGDWGKGAVHLVQNPTDKEFEDNIVAFWQPADGAKKGQRLEFAYTLTWFGENGGLPPIGRVWATRIDYQDQLYFRKVILDFGGGDLANLPADTAVEADLLISDNGAVEAVSVQRNSNDGTWRLTFTPKTARTNEPVEMRAALTLNGRPVTETWSYTWQQ